MSKFDLSKLFKKKTNVKSCVPFLFALLDAMEKKEIRNDNWQFKISDFYKNKNIEKMLPTSRPRTKSSHHPFQTNFYAKLKILINAGLVLTVEPQQGKTGNSHATYALNASPATIRFLVKANMALANISKDGFEPLQAVFNEASKEGADPQIIDIERNRIRAIGSKLANI